MTRLSTYSSTWLALLIGAAAVSMLILVIVAQSLWSAVVFVLAVAVLAVLYRLNTYASAKTTVAQPRSSVYEPQEPMLIEDIVTPDGQILQVGVVPLEHMDGHRMLLTAEGYVIVDDTGRLKHKLPTYR